MGSAFLHSSAENSPLTQNTKNSDMLPEDFRLGTKLRIISKVPFPWMKNSKVVGLCYWILMTKSKLRKRIS